MSATDPYVVALAPHVHAFVQPDGGWCLNNAGFIGDTDESLLVDTAATERRARLLREAVLAEGLPLPRTVVSTHHHGDHTYGNGVFLPEARIVGHENCRSEQLAAGHQLHLLWPQTDFGQVDILPPSVTYRERLTLYVAAPVRTLARKPRSVGFEESAALPLVGLTAYQALHQPLAVGPGDTVLVHAAAGGVGSMGVQIARHLGCRVIGAAREAGLERVAELGAEPVVYDEATFADQVRTLAPQGVDAVLDTIGGPFLRISAGLLAAGGRLASIADGEVLALGGRYFWVRPDPVDLAALADLVDDGVLSVRVARAFPLEQAADAQRANAAGGLNGKVVVTVP